MSNRAASLSLSTTRRAFVRGAAATAGLAALAGLGLTGAVRAEEPAEGDSPDEGEADGAEASTPVEPEEWSFTDQGDYECTVTVPVEHMCVMQHHSLDMLCQLGQQDKVVGTESKWEGDLGAYMRDVFPGIDDLATPGDLSEWNVEELVSLQPDVVIAASQANVDAMQQVRDLGIPVVMVSLRAEGRQEEAQNPRLSDADAAYTDGCEWAIKTLGKLTGSAERADEIWEFCLESRQIVEDAVGDIPDEDRVRVFIANEGNQTYGNDKYVGCQLLRAGAVNVAAEDIQGYKEYTFEQVANWDPDVIIVQDRYQEVYDEITTDPAWSEFRAVKDGNVLLAPYWTKPWGNPDTDSIALGELWLAHQFYPDKVGEETVLERAQDFYQRFYGIEFDGTV